MRSIIVGMGIGSLYKDVLTNLGYSVVTVDPFKPADFKSVDDAINAHNYFDTAHICTPNFTHQTIARQLATRSYLIFVEKPGVENAESWMNLITDFPSTRFMMVKNNQWRSNINDMKKLVSQSKSVSINWINKDRVPSPGSWFTTNNLAYGGVSRDLTPHLLSIFMALEPNYFSAQNLCNIKSQNWSLPQLVNTDYGTVNLDGTYDVDDYHQLQFKYDNRIWNITANWRSMDSNKIDIEFEMNDGSIETIPLGLCPEEAYQNMIEHAMLNHNNSKFWYAQFIQDYWIHGIIQ